MRSKEEIARMIGLHSVMEKAEMNAVPELTYDQIKPRTPREKKISQFHTFMSTAKERLKVIHALYWVAGVTSDEEYREVHPVITESEFENADDKRIFEYHKKLALEKLKKGN